MSRQVAGWASVPLAVLVFIAACSSPSRPITGPPPAPSRSPSPSPAAEPSVLPPMPSAAFSGAGAFDMAWRDVAFRSTPCPSGHPLASCFSGTANGALPIAGEVTLARTMIAGDGTAPVDIGCVTAGTTGTLTSPTGTMTFQAYGQLCGTRSTFVVTSNVGTGSLAHYRLSGVIVNDTDGESWQGELTPS